MRAAARWRIVAGNPPHAAYARAWVVRLGRPASAAERAWFRAHGFTAAGPHWIGPRVGDQPGAPPAIGASAPADPPREFPVLRDWRERTTAGRRVSVPGGLVARHAAQAARNHGQTLEELARRGGLDPSELVAVLCDRRWQRMDPAAADAALEELVAAYLSPDPGVPTASLSPGPEVLTGDPDPSGVLVLGRPSAIIGDDRG